MTIHLTSNEATNGQGFTIQPKDFHSAPTEADAITDHFGARTVAITDDPQTYTAGIASSSTTSSRSAGIEIVLFEASEPDQDSYVALLRRVNKLSPDLLYVQTYYPQGVDREGPLTRWRRGDLLHGAGEPGSGLRRGRRREAAAVLVQRRSQPTGVPRRAELRHGLRGDVRYSAGTRGMFTYDSMKLLFDAVERAGGWNADEVDAALAETQGYEGLTGTITIDPSNGQPGRRAGRDPSHRSGRLVHRRSGLGRAERVRLVAFRSGSPATHGTTDHRRTEFRWTRDRR